MSPWGDSPELSLLEAQYEIGGNISEIESNYLGKFAAYGSHGDGYRCVVGT